MTIEDKLELLLWVINVSEHPLELELIDHVRKVYRSLEPQHESEEQDVYISESFSESFARYYHKGYITDDQIEEFWMRAVLEGLHNQYKEQTDA